MARSTVTFLQDFAQRIADARARREAPAVDGLLIDAERVIRDCAVWIENYEQNKKRALDTVRWIRSGGAYVALVGLDVYRLSGAGVRLRLVRLDADGHEKIDLGIVSSTEAAARRIRAYRAGKWPPKKGSR